MPRFWIAYFETVYGPYKTEQEAIHTAYRNGWQDYHLTDNYDDALQNVEAWRDA